MVYVGIYRYFQDSYGEPSYFLPKPKCRELKEAGKGEFINSGRGFRLYGVAINRFITSNFVGFWHNEHTSKLPFALKRKLGIRDRLLVTSQRCS
jgi:hypothetical protein